MAACKQWVRKACLLGSATFTLRYCFELTWGALGDIVAEVRGTHCHYGLFLRILDALEPGVGRDEEEEANDGATQRQADTLPKILRSRFRFEQHRHADLVQYDRRCIIEDGLPLDKYAEVR